MSDMIRRVASEVRFYFEIRSRENGEQFTALRDEAPDWCREIVRKAFGGRLPDDRRYKTISSAIVAIADGWATDEEHHEWCDSQVDIYHSDRAMWLASDTWREIHVDHALDAGLIDETAGIFARLGAGQYMEAKEVFGILWSALRERADEISRMVEDGPSEVDSRLVDALNKRGFASGDWFTMVHSNHPLVREIEHEIGVQFDDEGREISSKNEDDSV